MTETVFNLAAIFVRAHIYLKGAQKHVTHATHTNQTFISRATKTLVSKLWNAVVLNSGATNTTADEIWFNFSITSLNKHATQANLAMKTFPLRHQISIYYNDGKLKFDVRYRYSSQ